MNAQSRPSSPTTALLIAVLACGALACAWQAVRANSRVMTEQKARLQAESDCKQAEVLAKVALGRANEAQAVLDFYQTRILLPKATAASSVASVTLLQALEQAEPHFASDFVNEPLIEAAIRGAIAVSYQHLEAADQAIHQLTRAVELRTQALGLRHPATLSIRNNLGVAYERAGRHAESLPLLEEILRLKTEVLGPEHSETIIGINNLAMAHRQLHDPAKAIALLQPALERLTAQPNASHSDLLTCLNSLALTYLDLKQYDRATKHYEQMLEIASHTHGKSHPTTLRILESLATTLYSSNQPAKANALLAAALPLCRASAKQFPNHPDYQSRLAALESLHAQHFGQKEDGDQ